MGTATPVKNTKTAAAVSTVRTSKKFGALVERNSVATNENVNTSF